MAVGHELLQERCQALDDLGMLSLNVMSLRKIRGEVVELNLRETFRLVAAGFGSAPTAGVRTEG
jgi:hypothetical protein